MARSDLMFPDDNRSGRSVTRAERQRQRRADEITSEVQEAGLMGQGAFALAGHLMNGIRDLDDLRKDLAGEDPLLNVALGRIEARALRQVDQIQADLYSVKWGL